MNKNILTLSEAKELDGRAFKSQVWDLKRVSQYQKIEKWVDNEYIISQAALFDGGYLSRTFGAPDDGKTNTISFWMRRNITDAGGQQWICKGGTDYGVRTSSDSLYYVTNATNAIITTALYRDPTAWVHVVMVWDSTELIDSDRVRLYINGEQVTDFSGTAYPVLNAVTDWLSATAHFIGGYNATPLNPIKSEIAEFVSVDGLALGPSSFGKTDLYGNWVPIDVSGLTFGTNGFYLNFSNAGALGTDNSGNGNNWTVNGDITQVLSSPTDYGTTIGNFATLDPNYPDKVGLTLSNGNLSISTTAATMRLGTTLAFPGTGSFSAKCTIDATPSGLYIGIARANSTNHISGVYEYVLTATGAPTWQSLETINGVSGSVITNTTVPAAASDEIEVLYDNGDLQFIVNGTLYSFAFLGFSAIDTSYDYVFSIRESGTAGTHGATWDFGQNGYYPTLSKYKTLSTANLPSVSSEALSDHFNTVLYTGDGVAIGSGGQAITGVGFQPDFVWIKHRSGASGSGIYDSLRGATKRLISNSTDAEATQAESLASFDADGFTVGNNTAHNGLSETYVAWCAKLPSDEVNTSGDITVTWKYNATLGMAIGTYTGNGVAGATLGIPAEFGSAPFHITTKNRSTAVGWINQDSTFGGTHYLELNTTIAATANSGVWNNTSATASYITLGTSSSCNTLGDTYLIIAFFETDFCKPINFTGNGSTSGPFDYLGGTPQFSLSKNASVISGWPLHDATRNPFNLVDAVVYSNVPNSESTTTDERDFLSTGVKMRSADDGNGSGNTIIGVAFVKPLGVPKAGQRRAT